MGLDRRQQMNVARSSKFNLQMKFRERCRIYEEAGRLAEGFALRIHLRGQVPQVMRRKLSRILPQDARKGKNLFATEPAELTVDVTQTARLGRPPDRDYENARRPQTSGRVFGAQDIQPFGPFPPQTSIVVGEGARLNASFPQLS